MRYSFIAVYIVANRKNGAIYTGETSDLRARMGAHKVRHGPGFAARHGCDRLVYYERFETMAPAIAEEKRIKNWRRSWKIDLIEQINPHGDDLHSQLPYG